MAADTASHSQWTGVRIQENLRQSNGEQVESIAFALKRTGRWKSDKNCFATICFDCLLFRSQTLEFLLSVNRIWLKIIANCSWLWSYSFFDSYLEMLMTGVVFENYETSKSFTLKILFIDTVLICWWNSIPISVNRNWRIAVQILKTLSTNSPTSTIQSFCNYKMELFCHRLTSTAFLLWGAWLIENMIDVVVAIWTFKAPMASLLESGLRHNIRFRKEHCSCLVWPALWKVQLTHLFG